MVRGKSLLYAERPSITGSMHSTCSAYSISFNSLMIVLIVSLFMLVKSTNIKNSIGWFSYGRGILKWTMEMFLFESISSISLSTPGTWRYLGFILM